VQGIWFLFLGWLILSAARQSAQMNEYKFRLSGLQAGQVMFWPLVTLPAGTPLSEALHSPTSVAGQPLYPVVDLSGQTIGVLDHHSLIHVTPAQWAELSVEQVMSPLEPEMQIQAHEPVTQALTRLGQGREWLLVISPDSRPVGVVTEESIVRAGGRREPRR
jgi:CBS domain-containing protein